MIISLIYLKKKNHYVEHKQPCCCARIYTLSEQSCDFHVFIEQKIDIFNLNELNNVEGNGNMGPFSNRASSCCLSYCSTKFDRRWITAVHGAEWLQTGQSMTFFFNTMWAAKCMFVGRRAGGGGGDDLGTVLLESSAIHGYFHIYHQPKHCCSTSSGKWHFLIAVASRITAPLQKIVQEWQRDKLSNPAFLQGFKDLLITS